MRVPIALRSPSKEEEECLVPNTGLCFFFFYTYKFWLLYFFIQWSFIICMINVGVQKIFIIIYNLVDLSYTYFTILCIKYSCFIIHD